MTPATADLRAIRESFGISSAQFARLLRVDRSTWHKWESGVQGPPAIAVTAIQLLLHMRDRAPEALAEWRDGCE